MNKKQRIKIDHTNCECMIKQKGPHWGLFCAEHGSYIKWLSAAELVELQQLDIPCIRDTSATRLDELPLFKFSNG